MTQSRKLREERLIRSCARYEMRYAGERVGRVYADLRELMAHNFRRQIRLRDVVDTVVRRVVARHGIARCRWIWFFGFGREVWGRWRRWRSKTLENELRIVLVKWRQRGLEPEVLAEIMARVIIALERQRRFRGVR